MYSWWLNMHYYDNLLNNWDLKINMNIFNFFQEQSFFIRDIEILEMATILKTGCYPWGLMALPSKIFGEKEWKYSSCIV